MSIPGPIIPAGTSSRPSASDWEVLSLALPAGQGSDVVVFEEVAGEATWMVWRALRWSLMASGQMALNGCLSLECINKDWQVPLKVGRPHESCASIPGLEAQTMKSVWLQPPPVPDPTDVEMLEVRRAEWAVFERQIDMALNGYRLKERHPSGQWGEDVWRTLSTSGAIYGGTPDQVDAVRRKIAWHWPTAAELLQMEATYLSLISERLTMHSEEAVRRELLSRDVQTIHEANSLTQSAKRLAFSGNILDVDVERATAIRRLEAIADKALEMVELPTAVSASRELAKVAGLYKEATGGDLEGAIQAFAADVERSRLAASSGKIVDVLATSSGKVLPGNSEVDFNVDTNPNLLKEP